MRMSLRCKVQIGIDGLSEHEAGAIKKALEPDNVKMPEDMQVIVMTDCADDTHKDRLTLEFIGRDSGREENNRHGIGHLVGTVDEVLEHVQVALKVIRQC